ncbi:MAG: cytidine deaminase [Verrucomicrobiota bacterium]
MYKHLIDAAHAARANAYAPYSKFSVGAALLSKSGQIFCGGNVENISLGLTICAERTCVVIALAKGQREFEAIAIVSDSAIPVVPCGACRQVLAEFSPNLHLISATLNGMTEEFELGILLPKPKQGILA